MGNKGNYVVFDQAIFDRFFGKNDDAKKAFYDAIKANGGGSIYQSDSLADLAGRFNTKSLTTSVTMPLRT